MSFVNKEAILESVFIDEHTGKVIRPNIFAQEFERDTMSILLSQYGVEVKYYTDDRLFEKFGGDLPMDIDGEVIVFYYVPDAIKMIRSASEEVAKKAAAMAKEKRKERFQMYGI